MQFWNVLSEEWFKGDNISGSRRVPLDKDRQRGTGHEFAQECGDRRILRRPECPQSRMAAEKLEKLGYENVRAYEGGLEEWKAAGSTVVRPSALKRKRNRRRSR